MADKSFEELKEELKSKLEAGYILDDEKMADLEQALKDNGNDISKIDISKYSKKEQEAPESSNDQKNQGTVISDHDNSGDENTHEPSEPVDENWKEDYKREWRQWAEENNKEFEDVNIPGSGNDVQIRLFDSKEQKKKGEYAAQISYKSPHNVSLSGANGKVPDSKYFEQTVALAMKKNGPDIEFGDINSPEFKAKLLAACYTNGANPVNSPTEEEMAQWPKELQDMVNAAKEKAEKGAEKTTEPEKTSKETKYQKALAEMKNLKKDMDISTMSDEDKVIYMAAAMNGAEVAIAKNKDIKLNGALKAQEAIKLSQKMDLSDEDRKAIKEGLTKYAFFEMRERLSKSKEQTDLYKQNSAVTKELTTQRKDLDRAMESDGADHEAAIENYEKALTERFERTLAYKKDEKTGEIVERTDEEKKAYLDILRGRSAALDKQKDQTNNPRQEINKDVLKKFIDSHSQTK